MTKCQQNKQSLDRLEIYPPIFFGNQMVIGDGSSLFFPRESWKLTRVEFTILKVKNAGHNYGAVYYGKLKFTIVNFL